MSGDGVPAERRLLERLRAGDAAALGEVYDAHHVSVRAFAQRLVGDSGAAEDLVQDTFMALPRAARSFRGEASLRTFVLSIAVNHVRHHVRAAARQRAVTARFARQPVPCASSPADDAQRAELAAALVHALDRLPIDQRVAIVLCEVEERTSAEAALIVGVPEATVRTRLFHARRKLAEALEREGVR
ncbi:MAG TPA: RNA polymerase sigma factor [Polyangiaceae bacterium]|nr:RNA polymerase sigma factor [Polyangiaceae bacterium]